MVMLAKYDIVIYESYFLNFEQSFVIGYQE